MDPNERWLRIVEGAKTVLSHPVSERLSLDDATVVQTHATAVGGQALAAEIARLCEWLHQGGFPPDVLVPQPKEGPMQGLDVIAHLTALIEPMKADPNAKLAALAYVFEQTARRSGLNVMQAVDLLCSAWARGENLGKGGS